jgi:hypothetical protein
MIRDTVAAVFREPAYNRTSLLQIVGAWLNELLGAILLRFRPGRMPAPLFWFIVMVTLLVAAGAVARTATILARQRAARRRGLLGTAGRGDGDAWLTARQLAGRGDYTAAAHALYAGILDAIARRGEVELHESKTIGDYARDLAARSSAVLDRFRDFARTYEVVIYGIGSCDRDRYERLDGLALRILDSGA